MDEYLKNMKEFTPEAIDATGVRLKVKPITVVESLPQETAVKDTPIDQGVFIPKYLVPKKIEVKRYILKK